MQVGATRIAAFAAAAVIAGLVVTVSASATIVRGQQVPITGTKYEMRGDLVGKWKITKAKVIKESPIVKLKGEEKFNGCIDSNGDGSCEGETTGKLYFKFKYWAAVSDDGDLELGTCAHPVTGGKDGFAGASGFLMMVDIPNGSPAGFKTHYEGDISVGAAKAPPTPGTC